MLPPAANGLTDPVVRRTFLTRTSAGLGAAAVAGLLNPQLFAAARGTHFAPRARRMIYLFMSGGPSHVDLYDPKLLLRKMHGQELPPGVRGTQRLTLMTRDQKGFPCAG